jgi:hypothetical protein
MKTKALIMVCLLSCIGLTQLSAQTLHKGAVLAIKNFTLILQPDVTMNQFLDFYKNKQIPQFEKSFPGVKLFVLKGDRGEKKYQYVEIQYFESVEVRDKYWKDLDVPTDEGKLAKEKMLGIFEETFKYVVDWTEESTEWIIL